MDAPHIPYPDKYPELLDQIGQIMARVLVKHGVTSTQKVLGIAMDSTEEIRRELGGAPLYLSKGLLYDLSLRDAEIYAKFNGLNYVELAHEYDRTVVQIRTIVRRGRAADIARRQGNLF